jgi:hypothetical protein
MVPKSSNLNPLNWANREALWQEIFLTNLERQRWIFLVKKKLQGY